MVNRKLMADLESRTFRSFGELARYLRQNSQISQRQLAHAMGFGSATAPYIHQVEWGREVPSPRLIAGYARYFHVGLSSLLALDAKDAYSHLAVRLAAKAQKARASYQ